jgi:hypothetical protein
VASPRAIAEAAPRARYVSEWWLARSPDRSERRAATSTKELVAAYERAAHEEGDPPLTWARANGSPIALAVIAAQRIGWHFTNTNCVIDDEGCATPMAFASPARVKKLVTEAVSAGAEEEPWVRGARGARGHPRRSVGRPPQGAPQQ